jgi:hypothetical protein
VIVEQYQRRGRSGTWVKLVDELDERPFLVDDGSGQRARILPRGGTVLVEDFVVASSGPFRDPPPHLAAFLGVRNIASTSALGFNLRLQFKEAHIAPGQQIYALGPSRRDPGAPVADGYRTTSSTALVLFSLGTGDGELLLSSFSEDALGSRLLRKFALGIVLDVLSVAVVVAGFALR